MGDYNPVEYYKKRRKEETKDKFKTLGQKTIGGIANAFSGGEYHHPEKDIYNPIDYYNKRRQEDVIGFDTFESDLNAMSEAINSTYSGWQSRKKMKRTRKNAKSMYDRLSQYQEYQKKYGGTDLSNLHAAYKATLDDLDSLSKLYGQYENEEEYKIAYNESKKLSELYSLSTKEIKEKQDEITNLEDIYETIKAYQGDIWKSYQLAGVVTSDKNPNSVRDKAHEEINNLLKSAEYSSIDELKKGINEKKIAYTTTDGQNITWESLYEKKEKEEDHEYLYNKISSMDDFEEYKTKGANLKNPTYSEAEKGIGIFGWKPFGEDVQNEVTYSIDNRFEIAMTDSQGHPSKGDPVYLEISKEELDIYNYYLGKEKAGKLEAGTAKSYLDSIYRDLEDRYEDKFIGNMAKWADESPVVSSAFSVPVNLISGAEYIADSTKHIITGEKLDDNFMAKASSTIRGTVSQKVDWEIGNWDAFDFLYNTGMSMADSGAAMILGGTGATVLGFSAAAQGTNDALARGLDDKSAFWSGLSAGVFEGLFEKCSIEKFETLKKAPVDGIKSIIKNVGKSMLTNASEETLTELANLTYDYFANGDLSQAKTQIRAYMNAGMSEKEATRKVALEQAAQVGEAGLSGVLMGFGFGGIGGGYAYFNNKSIGQTIKSNERVGELFDIASNPEVASAYETYTKYANKGIDADNIKDAQLGSLYTSAKADAIEALKSKKTTAEQKLSAMTTLAKLSVVETDNTVKKEARKLNVGEETKVTNTGEAIDVKALKVEGDKVVFASEKGDVSVDDMTLTQRDAELVVLAKGVAQTDGDNAANLFLSMYNGQTDVYEYANSFNLTMEYAKKNYSYDTILNNKGSLTTEQVKAIYRKARIEVDKSRAKAIKELNKKMADKKFYKGVIDDSVIDYDNTSAEGKVNWNDLDARQRQAVTFIKGFAQATGMNLVLEHNPKSKYGGKYEVKDNTITIDISKYYDKAMNLKETIIPTMSHETTHWMKEKSPELWRNLNEIVFSTLTDHYNSNTEQAIKDKIELLDRLDPRIKHTEEDAKERTITEEDLIRAEMNRKGNSEEISREEIIARACEDMLRMSKQGRKIFNSLSETEQKTFVEKIKAIINDLLTWVDEFLNSYESTSTEARIMREYKTELQKASKVWDAMLEQSVEANQSLEKSGAFKHQVSVEGDVLEQAREIDVEGNPYWQIETDKDIFKGIESVEGLQKAAFNYILKGDKGNKITDLIDGKKLEFIRVSAKEYVYGDASKTLSEEEYKQKMRMSTSIIDLIENAPIEYDAPDHKNHKLFPNGFKNYQGRVGIDETIFRYIVRVGKAKNGMIFYDINLEVDGKVPRAKRTSLIKSSTSNNSISNPGEKVNTKISTKDSTGREFSKGQQEYFKESKVRAETVTFNSEQAKLTSNLNPTKNKDIRYADRDAEYMNSVEKNDKITITKKDVEAVQNIPIKSISQFTSQQIADTKNFARKYFEEMGFKSPFFRAWFGDWRANDITPVQIVTQKSSNRGTFKNEDTNWSIQISGKVFSETKAQNSTKVRKAIPYLDYIEGIVKNAVLLDTYTIPQPKAKSNNSAMMHSLYAVVNDGKGQEVLKLLVEELNDVNSDGTILRSYQLQDIIKIPMASVRVQNNLSSLTNTIGTIKSVSDLFEVVKNFDKDFKPKPSSLVVNDDGTPKLVYHTTDESFNVFDITRSRSWDGVPDYDLPGFYFAENYNDSVAYGNNVGEYYIKISNPYEGDIYALSKEKGSYRKAYDYLIKQGYDGVIVDEFGEGYNEYIVLKPENIKSATDNVGTFDGNSQDIRYSDREDTNVYDLMGEKERLIKENSKLKADVERLRERLKLERKVTKGNHFNENQLGAVAGHLRKISKSNMDKVELMKSLKELYSFIANSPQLTWEEVYTKSYRIAEEMLKDARPDITVDKFYKDILKDIKKTRISLSESQKKDAAYYFDKNWNRHFFGKVIITDNGTPIDKQWSEWAEQYPGIFDADISDGDMIRELYDTINSLKDASEIIEEYDAEEQRRWLANEIYNQYWNVSVIKTTGDKLDKQIKMLNFEHRKAMSDLRAGYNSRLKEQHKADMEHSKAMQTKIREQRNEKLKEQHNADKDKYKSLVKEIRKRKDNEIARAKEHGKAMLEEYKENAERKTRIQSITSNALSLNEMLVKNSKDKHVPEIMRGPVVSLLQAIDFSSKRLLESGEPTQKDISLSKSLNKIKDMMVKASNAHDELIELYGHGLDEEIENMVDSVDVITRTIGDNQFVLNKMTVSDLRTLDKIIKTIKHAVNKMNKFHTVNHALGVANLSQDSMQYLDSLGKNKIYTGFKGKAKKLLDWGNALPYYVFKRFGSGGMKVYEALQNGWDKFAFNIKKIIDFAKNTYTNKEVKEWSKEVKTFKILTPASAFNIANPDYVPQYQEVQMTIPQIMSMYCLNKREQARKHLFQGGIRVADFKNEKGDLISQSEGIIFTEKDVQVILNSLSERQKEVADRLQEFMNTVCTDWGNYVSMARFGYKAFGEENYFPIQSDNNNLATDDETERINSLFRLLNMSFTKNLDEGANNRIVISDIFDVFAQHTSDMAKYNALALPVLDSFKWYNYKEKEDIADGTFKTNGVKQAMEKAFGKDGQKYFTTFLKDMNGQQEVSRDTLGNGFFKNAKIASVGANLRVILLQPTSYARASAVIDNKYLTKALIHKPKIKKAEMHCGIALWKSMGYYDTNIQKGVEAQIKHNDTWKDKATEWSMKGAEIADKVTWGYLWNACELEVRDKRKDLRVGSQEFYEAIGKRLRDVIYATQVVDSTMTRSQMMRSSDRGDKMLTAFASEPTLAYNMLQDAYMEYSLDARRFGKKEAIKKNGKRMARVVFAYTMTNALAALIESGFDALRDDDDEEMDMIAFKKLYLSNFANDMSITGKIPYIKEFHSLINGFNSSRTDTQWMEEMTKATTAWYKIFNGKGNASTAIKYSIKAISDLSGLPFYSVYRDSMAILNKLDLFTADDLNEMFEDFLE